VSKNGACAEMKVLERSASSLTGVFYGQEAEKLE
jgi:hypothetical protein